MVSPPVLNKLQKTSFYNVLQFYPVGTEVKVWIMGHICLLLGITLVIFGTFMLM